ncbi:MAG: hypothetical protein D6753_03950 [Planctomycetota bacterium]|nr:MAG: hypothetical protein D6753_03950 [Planctomycetota bacterium]
MPRWAAWIATGCMLTAACWPPLSPCTAAAEPRAQYAPRTEQQHPSLVLPRIDDGSPASLEQWRGKKVLLIHFASW